jgi:hypothetical protein
MTSLLSFTTTIVLLLSLPGWVRSPRSGGVSADEAVQGQATLVDIPLKSIDIDDQFWAPRIEVNRTQTIDHVYSELEQTGSIRNFDLASGKARGKFGGPWWSDSDVYK